MWSDGFWRVREIAPTATIGIEPDIEATFVDGSNVPQSVNSIAFPGCNLHEWPVFPLRGGSGFYADAAFPALRARAARKSNSQVGLIAAIKSVVAISHHGHAMTDTDGPKPTFEVGKKRLPGIPKPDLHAPYLVKRKLGLAEQSGI